jgi:hypothetical protein
MDESEQEKVAALSAKIDGWFQSVHDGLLKDETELDTIIRIAAASATTEPYKSINALASMIKATIHNIGGAFDVLHQFSKDGDVYYGKIAELYERISSLRKDLDTSTSSTETTLAAINKFVEHYTPILDELEHERDFRQNVGAPRR